MKSAKNKSHSLLTTIIIVLISFSYLPDALNTMLNRDIYFPIEKDTGFDTGIRAVISGLSSESIEDLFASTYLRQQLPALFDETTLFDRFPMDLVVWHPAADAETAEILWIFDSMAAPEDVKSRPLYHFNDILKALIKSASEIGSEELTIVADGRLEELPSTLETLFAAVRRAWRAPFITAAVAFLILFIVLRRSKRSPIQKSMIATLLPAIVITLIGFLHVLGQSGWFNPTYMDRRYTAWRHIAIEQQFSVSREDYAIGDEYLWSEYPATNIFTMRAIPRDPQYAAQVSFDLELSEDIGVFRMSGTKESWLAMPQQKWEEYWQENPPIRDLLKWLHATGSLDRKNSQFQNAFELLTDYSKKQGVSIALIGSSKIVDNYPHIPIAPIITIAMSIAAAVISLVLHRIASKKMTDHRSLHGE